MINTMIDPISVEKQGVAALDYLADEGRMQKVTNFLAIGKSAILKITRHDLFFPLKIFPLYLFNKAKQLFQKQKIIQN